MAKMQSQIITIAFLGDIFGSPGRMVVQQQLPNLVRDHTPDIVIANAENARSGSGLSPQLYRKIRGYGIDAITLGDHVYRDRKIIDLIQSADEPICRPANLSKKAPGKSYITLKPTCCEPKSLFISTVLGRIFTSLPADDPFACVDRLLGELPDRKPLVIVEAHMEATSEKAALAKYLDGRVALVVGSHTHVPTADARILKGGTGFITDLGMCGPYDSVIGRDHESVVHHMTTGVHTPYAVGAGGEALCGVIAKINTATGSTTHIEGIQYVKDESKPPFSQ